MQLDLFRSLWGFAGQDYGALARQTAAEGYAGFESRLPEAGVEQREFAAAVAGEGLEYIAVGFTSGYVVPDPQAGIAAHLESLRQILERAAALHPRHLTLLAGNDRWTLTKQVEFFGAALELADQSGLSVLFESHRGRSFYSPWLSLEIIAQLPALRFTSDISHWVVVSERLLTAELDLLAPFTTRVVHVQARVGYDQGPQVPHPAAPEYAAALAFHAAHWAQIWQAQRARGMERTTVTPEFGPDGYLHHLPFTDMPVANLSGLNDWMATWLRAHFDELSR